MAVRTNSTGQHVKSDCYSSLRATLAEFEEFREGTYHSTVGVLLDLHATKSTTPLPKARPITAAFEAFGEWENEWSEVWTPGMLINRPALFIKDRWRRSPSGCASILLEFGRRELEEYPLYTYIGFPRAEPMDALLATQARLSHSIAYRYSGKPGPGWIFRGKELIRVARARVLRRLAVEEAVDRFTFLTQLNAALAAEANEIAVDGHGPVREQIRQLKAVARFQYYVNRLLTPYATQGTNGSCDRDTFVSRLEEVFHLAQANDCEHEFSSAVEWAMAKSVRLTSD